MLPLRARAWQHRAERRARYGPAMNDPEFPLANEVGVVLDERFRWTRQQVQKETGRDIDDDTMRRALELIARIQSLSAELDDVLRGA